MNDRLEDLLAEFFEARERGEVVDVDAFVRAHQDVPGLAAALASAAHTDALLPAQGLPAQIGGYRVLDELGRGGTGRVLRVVDPHTQDAPLALKLLAPTLRGNARAVERFRREIEALRRIHHPAVIAVRECGEHEGTPFLVMELVEGDSLATRVARARAARTGREAFAADGLELPGEGTGPQRAAALVAALARGVQAVHDQGLLHRDLKPSNVLVRARDGSPVLIDFGLAGDDAAATLTATGDVLGTPAFMAPEQARGEAADPRTDVYGLGAILYELLTLEVPHPGSDPTRVLAAVQTTPPRPVRRLDPRVPHALAAVVRRAMSYRASRRYATAADLATVLDALAGGRAVPRASVSLAARLEDVWRFHRRRVALGASLLTAVVALLAVSAWHAQRRREDARARAIVAASAWVGGQTDAARAAAEALLAADSAATLGRYVLARLAGTPTDFDPYFAALAAGEDCLRAGKPRDALVHLQQAVDVRREEPLGIALLGVAAARAGDLDRAVRELSVSVRLLPRCTYLLGELADVQHRRKDDGQAVAAMQQAVAIDASDPRLWRDLARMQNYAHDYDGGLASIERALALAGADPPVDLLRVKGVMLDGLRRLDEAAVVMRDVVARAPSAETWMSLGVTLDRAHRIDEAAAAYEAAIALEPGNGRALLNLAYLHAGSDSARCERCRAFFAAHPSLRDPAKVETFALRALAVDADRYPMAASLAASVQQAGGSPAFAAEIARLLETDIPPDGLGRLLKAQRVLAGR